MKKNDNFVGNFSMQTTSGIQFNFDDDDDDYGQLKWRKKEKQFHRFIIVETLTWKFKLKSCNGQMPFCNQSCLLFSKKIWLCQFQGNMMIFFVIKYNTYTCCCIGGFMIPLTVFHHYFYHYYDQKHRIYSFGTTTTK